jgi:hypothetical protein
MTSATSEVATAITSPTDFARTVSDASHALPADGEPAFQRAVQVASGSSSSQVSHDTDTVEPSSMDPTHREGEQIAPQATDEDQAMADPRAAAAKELLLKVARTPYPAYLTLFPEWETRVFQLLGRPHDRKATASLGETMRLLAKLKLNHNPAANELLGRCVDRILQILDVFPRVEGGEALKVRRMA